MGDSKPYLRLFTFAGVLILVSGLLVGLFSGAGAVEMSFDQPTDEVVGDETFTVNIQVPQDQTVPIESLDAVVEKQDDNRDDKIGADVVVRESCEMNGADTDCSFSGAVSRIQVTGFLADGEEIAEGYAYEYDQDRTVERTGYGYDEHSPFFQENGYGYGYGYKTGDTTSENLGEGYGYGYTGDGELTIQVEITVDADQLEDGGTYYLTALADTGSQTIGELSSPFTQFQATHSSGDGGFPPEDDEDEDGGGGGGGGGGGAADAAPIEVEPGESFDIEVDGKVHLTNLGPGFNTLGMVFVQACEGCSVEFSPSDEQPAGTPDTQDAGFNGKTYFSATVTDADGNPLPDAVQEGAFLDFQVDQDALDADEDPRQVVLLHHTNPWEPEPTELVSDADADPLEYNASIRGFSDFAIATDEDSPEITNAEPTGEVNAITPELSADFEDNRGIDTDSFQLVIDGDEVTSADGSLTVSEDGFTYVPGQALDEATHDIEATIADESGLETTESWSFQVTDVVCDPAPAILTLDPADGAEDVALDTTITASVQEGECPIDGTSVTVNGDAVDSTYEDGELTASLPDSVEAGETVTVTATVTDAGENVAERSWSFTTTDTPDDEGPAPGAGDEGLSGLAWTIIALIVLAIIGVAAYFYTQQAE